jgi:hypothetical protein
LEHYNTTNSNLEERYKNKVSVLLYKFKVPPDPSGCWAQSKRPYSVAAQVFVAYAPHCVLFLEIICTSVLFNEEQHLSKHEVTLQYKLNLLSSWLHDGIVTDRDKLVGFYKEMTAGAGSQRGYANNIIACVMTMGREATDEMLRLWPTSSMATIYFKLPWTKLKDDVARQVRQALGFIVFIHFFDGQTTENRN